MGKTAYLSPKSGKEFGVRNQIGGWSIVKKYRVGSVILAVLVQPRNPGHKEEKPSMVVQAYNAQLLGL